MTNEDYHADTSAISASDQATCDRLRTITRRIPTQTALSASRPPPLKFGTGLPHCAILSLSGSTANTVSMPEGLDRRTTAGKQAYTELLATGAEILASEDMSLVMNMACAFRDNEISRALFDRKTRRRTVDLRHRQRRFVQVPPGLYQF